VLKGSNKEVVLKVLKPGVSDILTADLSFLYVASRVLEFLNPELKRTSLSAIVGDIRASMMEEVDFLKEQRNIGQFQVRASLFMVAHFTHAKRIEAQIASGSLQPRLRSVSWRHVSGGCDVGMRVVRVLLRGSFPQLSACTAIGLAEGSNERVWTGRTIWNA
jgi:hypothetical protein